MVEINTRGAGGSNNKGNLVHLLYPHHQIQQNLKTYAEMVLVIY